MRAWRWAGHAAGLRDALEGLQVLRALVEQHVRAVRPIKLLHLCNTQDNHARNEAARQDSATAAASRKGCQQHLGQQRWALCQGALGLLAAEAVAIQVGWVPGLNLRNAARVGCYLHTPTRWGSDAR